MCAEMTTQFLVRDDEDDEAAKLQYGGYLGLARNAPFAAGGKFENSGYGRGPSFLQALVDAGSLAETTFTVHMDGKDNSFMEFGSYRTNYMKD